MRVPALVRQYLVWHLCALSAVAAEPVVHMLVPGFTVRELPVRLPNLNNLRFAPNGSLTALGYNGKIWLLRDSDADGLEDTAESFCDKPTLSVPVGMAWSTAGLFISSHGKVSLLRDTDDDGKADTEEIIASGWPPTDVGSGGVDATAVTLDKDGNVYFGLLVADYSNAYRLRKRKDLKPEERAWLEAHGDKGGPPDEEVSLYDIHSPRGTIQKWSPKTKELETIATGIRVPFALAFNKIGDLFNTDQEGETWMPNGNPLDELNHIVPGRNYGFPPRHEKWLPDLISEPPVVAFGPQHESTCGLVFNEPHGAINLKTEARNGNWPLPAAPAQGLFGPKWWEGDAFIAGESRGKIWRVRLVKTPHGYVGKQFLIARLSMLTLDLAISPKGDLYVCCHSGLPDWGTGPNGEGKIFKISYTDPKAPQPVIAWAAGPTEARVAFDKALDPSVTNAIVGQQIEYGEYVRAADRYEVLKPPYQVVKEQEAAPRGGLNILGAKLEDKNHTLVLTTETHNQAVKYALTIPNVRAEGKKNVGEEVNIDYDLSGANAAVHRWTDSIATSLVGIAAEHGRRDLAYGIVKKLGYEPNRVSGTASWLPTPDLDTASRLALPWDMPALLEEEAKRGKGFNSGISFCVTPSIQTLVVRGTTNFWVTGDGKTTSGTVGLEGSFTAEVHLSTPRSFHSVLIESKAGKAQAYSVYCRRQPQGDLTPLALSESFVAWVPTDEASVRADNVVALAVVNGDFESGRSLFFGDRLKCSTCHRIRGEGATIGPDLSNLVSRDAASVLRDIKEPSASINPDYVAYNVALNDGDELTGFIRAQDNASIKLIAADGKEAQFRPTDVREMRPSGVSLMPTGLLDALKEEQVRDLLTFLLNEPPKRTAAEVEAVLRADGNRQAHTENRKLRIVLVASKQDHGPGQHDYPAWQKKWHSVLAQAPGAEVSDAWLWPTPEQFQQANLLVFYYWNHEWNAEKFQQLDALLARGGGVALFHSAVIGNDDAEPLAARMGLASFSSPRTSYRHTPLDLKIVAPQDNAIMRGLPRQIHFLDEPYWPLTGDTNNVTVLAATSVDGEDRPMMWTFENGKGRVFGSVLGHYTWTLDDPLFRIIALRGLAWAAGEPCARFERLTSPEPVSAGQQPEKSKGG